MLRYIRRMGTSLVVVWTLGDRLAKARRVSGVSRDEMADYLGLSPQAVSNYEADRRTPKLGMVRLWALRTGVELEWLRYGDTMPRPEVVAGAPGLRKVRAPSTKWLMGSPAGANSAVAA